MRVEPKCIEQVESALEEYRTEVGNTAPSHASRRTCRTHAERFVRWSKDRFAPGTRVNRQKHAFVHCFVHSVGED